LFHYFFRVQSQFGDAPHPLEVWLLRLHGAAAMLVLVVLGSLLPVHVRRGWHQRRNLLAGSLLAAIALLLIGSGYALYYFGGEELRPWISAFHWIIGLGALPLLVWHIVRGRAVSHARQSRSAAMASEPSDSRVPQNKPGGWVRHAGPATLDQGSGPS
jgi:hypothetical protein